MYKTKAFSVSKQKEVMYTLNEIVAGAQTAQGILHSIQELAARNCSGELYDILQNWLQLE